MAWSQYQIYRLAVEKRILAEHMPDFKFYHPTADTYVDGEWESSQGNRYRIVVTLPAGYPDECPSCYIADPAPLKGRVKPMEQYGNSHDMHTWQTDVPGWTKICTYKPACWTASHSIEKVLQKAMLWLEAFEAHQVTGRPLADFLMTMD